MRTFHLLKTPDILCANDTRLPSSYLQGNSIELKTDLPLVTAMLGLGLPESGTKGLLGSSAWRPSAASDRTRKPKTAQNNKEYIIFNIATHESRKNASLGSEQYHSMNSLIAWS
jgi:hypothetical protein